MGGYPKLFIALSSMRRSQKLWTTFVNLNIYIHIKIFLHSYLRSFTRSLAYNFHEYSIIEQMFTKAVIWRCSKKYLVCSLGSKPWKIPLKKFNFLVKLTDSIINKLFHIYFSRLWPQVQDSSLQNTSFSWTPFHVGFWKREVSISTSLIIWLVKFQIAFRF